MHKKKNTVDFTYIDTLFPQKKKKKNSFPYNLTQIGEWKVAKTTCILLFTPFQS